MKKALLAAAVLAAAALLAWLLLGKQAPEEQGALNQPQIQKLDDSASIKKDIESLQVQSPDPEFKDIDADLNQL